MLPPDFTRRPSLLNDWRRFVAFTDSCSVVIGLAVLDLRSSATSERVTGPERSSSSTASRSVMRRGSGTPATGQGIPPAVSTRPRSIRPLILLSGTKRPEQTLSRSIASSRLSSRESIILGRRP